MRQVQNPAAADVTKTSETAPVTIRTRARASWLSITSNREERLFFLLAIFIGLFSTPIPEGNPAACAILVRPGEFLIPGVRNGRYHVFALGLPWPDSLDGFFRYESALRGGGQRISIQNEKVKCDLIALREAASTDPPVLLNLPLLLDRQRDHRVA